MNLTRRRWVILLACCLINLCLGSIYSWSVFASSMADFLSNTTGVKLTTGDLAIVYTIANSVGPITMITGGWFNDKFGPKNVILVGGLMFGGGMVISGFATSVNFLIVSYGLISGLGLGMAYGSTISSCIKFFPDKRGLIGGITTAVYGFSSVILPPIITLIVNASDATVAFKAVGGVFLVVVCVSALTIIPCPQGFVPEGWTPPATNAGLGGVNKDWKEMLKSPIFYIMLLLLTCGAFSGMMIISQTSAVAKNLVGMSALAASTAVSVLALFNVAGRISAGYISDKIGRINTLAVACVLSVIGLILLYLTSEGNIMYFYAGISVVGISFGSFMGVFPGFTADQFGPRNNSVNFGIMFIGFALAGYFGPTVMRNVYATDGAYQRAFLISCALCVAGLMLTFVYRFVKKKQVN
ncbi:L-lactate MFS transporter [Anaerotignum sp.]|uniref:L-lactate MFS transporter n=1 Tax=Anaerotignum sp. TaxID=2039241 RepID=UPI0028A034AB|nr:OFA family MFS transporter [Anaerotignum sp.]